jgi:hypothetical protein
MSDRLRRKRGKVAKKAVIALAVIFAKNQQSRRIPMRVPVASRSAPRAAHSRNRSVSRNGPLPRASMPSANTKASPRKQSSSARPPRQAREFVVKNVREFHAGYQPSGGNGGVFCPTRSKLQVGDLVSVKVRLGRGNRPW